jgi:hypothetical protein
MSRKSPLELILLAAALLVALTSAWKYVSAFPDLFVDFRGFYCTAAVSAVGADPYAQDPLYQCEATPNLPWIWRASGNVALPASLPPYASVALIPLTRLPFQYASVFWVALLCCGYAIFAGTLRRLSGCSWVTLCAALLPAAVWSLQLGQIAVVPITALSLAALWLRQEKYLKTVAALTVAMIEPHVALPSLIAVSIAIPRSRRPVVIGLCTLCLISLASGISRNVEYLFRALPELAQSDLNNTDQFGLAAVMHVLGASDHISLLAGIASYIILAGLGIVAGITLSRRTGDPALLPLLPAAFSVFGGSYVHWLHLVAALPASFLLLRYSPAKHGVTALALVLLAVPWLDAASIGVLIPLAVASAAVLTLELFKPNLLIPVSVTFLSLLALECMNRILPANNVIAGFHANTGKSQLAAASWREFLSIQPGMGHSVLLWAHAPTWIGLGIIVSVVLWWAFWAGALQRNSAGMESAA